MEPPKQVRKQAFSIYLIEKKAGVDPGVPGGRAGRGPGLPARPAAQPGRGLLPGLQPFLLPGCACQPAGALPGGGGAALPGLLPKKPGALRPGVAGLVRSGGLPRHPAGLPLAVVFLRRRPERQPVFTLQDRRAHNRAARSKRLRQAVY